MNVFEQLVNVRDTRGAGYLVLVDPDRWTLPEVDDFVERINSSGADAIMVGSTLILGEQMKEKMVRIKERANLPVILFPGNINQLTPHVDAVLYLSIISGRNPQYLIGDQVTGAPLVRQLGLEAISTAYMLVESGNVTTAAFMSGTQPLPRNKLEITVAHALAAEYLGFKVIYLEAGSGARESVPEEMVAAVAHSVKLPIIVGGGIRTQECASRLVAAGASFVVTGNILESSDDPKIMESFANAIHTR